MAPCGACFYAYSEDNTLKAIFQNEGGPACNAARAAALFFAAARTLRLDKTANAPAPRIHHSACQTAKYSRLTTATSRTGMPFRISPAAIILTRKTRAEEKFP
jgi:hypothetical protein